MKTSLLVQLVLNLVTFGLLFPRKLLSGCFISLWISSLTTVLEVVVKLHVPVSFPTFLLLLASSFISLQLEKLIHVISILHLLRLVWGILLVIQFRSFLCKIVSNFFQSFLMGM